MAKWKITRAAVDGEIMPIVAKTVSADYADIEDGDLRLYDAADQTVYLAPEGTYLDCELIADPRAAGPSADANRG